MAEGSNPVSPTQKRSFDQYRSGFSASRAGGRIAASLLRALGNHLVGILHGCLRHHSTYDEHEPGHTAHPQPLDSLRTWDV